jgi:hypothetical protein
VTSVRTLASLSLSVLAALAACKGKPKHQEPPANVETAAGSATKGATAAPNLELPHGPGTPPDKTTKPLEGAALKKLTMLRFNGFLWNPGGNDKTVTIKHETETRPKIKATVTIEACNNDCAPMDLAKWKDKSEDLKQFLAPALKEAKDTTFEVGQTDLAGQPMIYTYQLGQAMKPDGGGAYTDTYVLYYNDGVNKIRVVAAYTDDPKANKEDMAKDVPKADLEKVAKAFVDAYTHAWAAS